MGLDTRVVTERHEQIGAGQLEAGDGIRSFDAVLADLRVRNVLQAAVFGDELDRWQLGRALAEVVLGGEGK